MQATQGRINWPGLEDSLPWVTFPFCSVDILWSSVNLSHVPSMHGDGGRTVLSFSEDILKAETLSSFIVNTHPIATKNSTMRCPSSRECRSDSVQRDVSLESKWVQMCLFFHFKLMRKSEIYTSFLFSFHYLCVSALNPRDLPSAQRLVCWGKPVLPILYRTFFL